MIVILEVQELLITQISNFDFVQKNQNKKKFISNNNLPMNGNFTMNIPIINKSAISSEEIIKKIIIK